MKNSIFFGIICLSFIFQSGVRAKFASPEEFEKVNSAIEASHVAVVENFLKNYTLTKQEKNDLLEKATTTLAEKQQRIRLLKSPWDLAKFASGKLLTTAGIFSGFLIGYIVYEDGGLKDALKGLIRDNNNNKINYTGIAFILSTPLSLGLGIFLETKGLKCSTALNRCENAKKIKGLIEGAQVA